MRTAHALALALLAGSTALAQSTDTAAWNRDLERFDHYLAPSEGGDNNFFTGISTASSDTNVSLIFAANARMNRFTQRLYRIRHDLGGNTPTGCTNDYLNKLTYFMPTTVTAPAGAASLQGVYNPAITYPEPIQTYGAFVNSDNVTDGLTAARAYRFTNWPAGTSASGTAETNDVACTNVTSNVIDQAACKVCLSTKGYWLNPGAAENDVSPAAGVFTTNWLRFHPVKWLMVTLAYKRLVAGPLLSQLREAVVVPNTGTSGFGGEVVQKMLPQSCHGQGRPQDQKLKAINGVDFSSAVNPLAELLFNTAWYMGGQQSTWVWSDGNTHNNSKMANGNSGPCTTCAGSGDFIVLFSDGRSDSANPNCDNNGSPAAFCNASSKTTCSAAPAGLGPENDGNDFDLITSSGGAPTFTAAGTRQTSASTCDYDVADDVAGWMATNSVSVGNAADTIHTYVVGIGDPNNTYGEMSILPEIASAGKGVYEAADNFQDLEKAINDVFTTIISRSTSFSSAAITTVQTQGFTSTFIPRFSPLPGAQWNGSLQRYNLYNEFSAGCTSANYNTKSTLNPNGNKSCFDVYLTDSNNNFIAESNGAFVQLDTAAAWDGGWPVKASADGGTIPAVPFWEASAVLTTRENLAIAGTASSERKIYTVAPSSANDGTYNPTLIAFSSANAATIAPLLELGGVNGDACTTLGTMTRHIYTTEAACAADVISFMNGRDVLLQNAYNRVVPQPSPLKARPNILGDIFHSTPVLVTPPAPTFLCDLGIIDQCVPSLYSNTLETNGATAYGSFYTSNQYRTEFVLVGSNDGMIHAFNAGNDTVTNGIHSYDLGTGDELWAFIPPELLPKLIRYVIGETHELFVDGTPMVRDIWVDGSGASPVKDNVKQADEFHTLAVIGDREGGRHYTALDVSNPTTPVYRWSWPKAGTTESLNQGGSWNDLGPAAAPIGPIAEYDAAGAFTVNGVKSHERYVVAVGGGFDPAFLRGRSIHMLDAWTGSQIYRFAQEDSQGGNDPRKYLGEVVAPVSMIDTDNDGIFDTAAVGDNVGQLWTISMKSPGQDLDGDGLYDNWFGGRAFVQFKASQFYKRSPFFQRTGAALISPGVIRLYTGAGDRYQIKDPDGGTCSLSNLESCVRKDCSVAVSSSVYNVGGTGNRSVTASFYAAANALAPDSGTASYSTAQGVASTDYDNGSLRWQISCGSVAEDVTANLTCSWSAGVDGGTDCPNAVVRPASPLDAGALASVSYSRFYSVRLFDGTRAQFASDGGAVAYDQAALTDTDLTFVGGAVTAGTSLASDTGNGWYVKHDNSTDEKTSSAPLLLGGCVTWKTLKPNANNQVQCDGTIPLDTAYQYQADVSTGAISCGQAGSATYSATVRATSTNTYVAPQSPSPVVAVNSVTGQVSYGSISLDPGTPPTAVSVGTSDILAPIHWLEVPRKVHDCRHDGTHCQ